MKYDDPLTVYFLSGDVPAFDWETDVSTQVYFKNSRLIITSAGKILDERNNYFIFMIVNPSDEDMNVTMKMMQNAKLLRNALWTILGLGLVLYGLL